MRITIGKRIGGGFGILMLATVVVFMLTYNTLSESRKIGDRIDQLYNPSVHALEELKTLIIESKMLIMNWVSVQISDDEDKSRLKELLAEDYPTLKEDVLLLAVNWTNIEQEEINDIMRDIDNLFVLLEEIMMMMNTWESYEDPMVVFMVKPSVEGGEVDLLATKILSELGEIIGAQGDNRNVASEKRLELFDDLEFVVRTSGIALVIAGMLIALFTVRSIVKPVQELKGSLLLMGKGMIPEKKAKISKDEIGDMSLAMNNLVEGVTRTTEFANEVGAGNFESVYRPLSEDDTLGHALLRMRKDLHESEKVLERKVEERTLEVVRQKEEIEDQNNEITASIRYAKRIQESILPDQGVVNKALKDHFILYKPKDIVSGDFYWIGQEDGKALFSAVDCTGHGVPGAFMSLIGSALLKEAVVEHGKTQPAAILNELNKLAGETINQTFEESTVKDGMDIAFCTLDYKTNILEYAGAYNSLYVIRKDESENLSQETQDLLKDDKVVLKDSKQGYILLEISANKFPIGVFIGEEVKKFTNHKIQLQSDDTIYIFSDGYVDQFGGPRGRKFMAKRFRPTLLGIQNLSLSKQGNYLNKVIEKWMNPNGTEETVYEQIDDILVIGVKV
ncbi:SpoIIE family protein phosphatase [Flavobacteriales bacterium AH-315-E23]|nr:SpoIIE family protein phosphatase [Flavobacteriales bacterium AH-315-E23]